MNAIQIFENLLNHRDVVVKDPVITEDSNGKEKTRYVINVDETNMAQEKARQMQEAFVEWLKNDPTLAAKYQNVYNDLFNGTVGREYDGSHLTFDGMTPFIELEAHQKNAVARAIYGGNSLFAHCVGAGKTFEMITAVMEKKRLGLIHKACVVVPKALTAQTAIDWLKLYPNAHILTTEPTDFQKNNRRRFAARVATGDYDVIVMSYEQFSKLPMSSEYREDFIQEEIRQLDYALDDLGYNPDKKGKQNQSVKALERAKTQLETKLKKLLEGQDKDEGLNFEEMGIDCLVVDEAHNYKNGLVVTKMSNVSGVTTRPSNKAEDMLMKCRYLNNKYGEKNILFSTGTPVSNSMTELYTMQNYLAPSLFAEKGIENFDDWAGTFGEVVTEMKLAPDGKTYKPKKSFSRFSNVNGLQTMFREYADVKTPEDLNLPVPQLETGKPITIHADISEFQETYVKQLAERAKAIAGGRVDPKDDNMLKITGEARLLGLDARCVDKNAENNPTGKVNLCIEKVAEIYKETAAQKGAQAIFCDVAVNSKDGSFSVYEYIKGELVERFGIKRGEIAFASEGDSNDDARKQLFADLRAGKKRVVVASTSKMGTGANFQTRLAAVHQLDIPWRPSDFEQRNGRIVRRGNKFEVVRIFHYVTKGTFDAYLMDIIVTKQKFITQLMRGQLTANECADVSDTVLNYAEIMGIASGDERVKERVDLDAEVKRLITIEKSYKKNARSIKNAIPENEKKLTHYNSELERTKVDEISIKELEMATEKAKADYVEKQKQQKAKQKAEKAADTAKKEETEDEKAVNIIITLNGRTITNRREANAELEIAIGKAKLDLLEVEIGAYGKFRLYIARVKETEFNRASNYGTLATALIIKGRSEYKIEMTKGNIGNIARLERLAENITKKVKTLLENIEKAQANLAAAKANADKPFERAQELADKKARLAELDKVFGISNNVIADAGEEEQQAEVFEE
ncbi:hypothetical protein AGMMS49975_25330 [Clostridia bacterium]|nr:hypothetical protein AGMMS49975_25330 [Clostridia bacterium]